MSDDIIDMCKEVDAGDYFCCNLMCRKLKVVQWPIEFKHCQSCCMCHQKFSYIPLILSLQEIISLLKETNKKN
jgi:hypothetical protein